MCVWVRVSMCVTLRRRISVWIWVYVSVHHSHYVQPCSCVSRVDVIKWGHFLSVWCLRNNPTAQKLLQPSASTYSNCPYTCTAVAMPFCLIIVFFMLFLVLCMIPHCRTRCLMPALLLTIWGSDAFEASILQPSWKMPRIETPVKSQIWAAMFVELSWFGLFSFIFTDVHARRNACLLVRGPFNLSEC